MADPKTITLHHNDLTFSALEQGDGPVVLCLHGFPDNNRSYRFQLPALAAAGYRAIAPTIRGYEPSSIPADGDYHVIRMAEDVVAWVDDLGVDKVHLVGHDWGAIMSYPACSLAPEKFHSLTTIAVPSLKRFTDVPADLGKAQRKNSWYIAFFQLKGIADFAVQFGNWKLIDKLWRDWSPGWELPREDIDSVKQTLAQPGVKTAALGYYRHLLDSKSRAGKETQVQIAKPIPVPTLAVTGAIDGCIKTELYDHVMLDEDFPNGMRVHRMAGAGHFAHQEKPDEFNALLLDWLSQNCI